MTAPVDTAFVEIKPDFGKFSTEVSRGIDDALRKVDASVARTLQATSADAAQAGTRVSQAFANSFHQLESDAGAVGQRTGQGLSQGVTSSLTNIELRVQDAGNKIAQSFQHGASIATLALTDLNVQAIDSGFVIGASFERGAEVAELALAELALNAQTDFAKIDHDAETSARHIADSSFGPAISKIKTVLFGLTLVLGAGLTAIAGFGLKSAASLEQTQIQFQSLTGNVQKGNQVMADLQKFAALTPFEFPDVAHGAARFLAFDDAIGMTDDQLQGFLTTIGNVISATGGGAQALDSVTLAMGQIASSGKLTLENLNQISESMPGFSGVAAIASARGETTAKVMQEISAGTINAKDGINELLVGMGKFPGAAGAMEKQGQTLAGVFSTFKDTISQSLAAGFAPVIPQLKAQLTQITPVLGQAIGQLAPVLGSTFTTLIALLAPLIQALVPVVTPIIDAIGQMATEFAKSGALTTFGQALGVVFKALAPLAKPLAELIDTIAEVLAPLLVELAPIIVALVPPVLDVLNALMPLIEAVGAVAIALAPLIDFGVRAIAMFADFAIIKPFELAIQGVALAITLAATAVKEFFAWIGKLDWGGIAKSIGGAFSKAWKAVTDFFSNLSAAFGKLPGAIGDAIHLMVVAAGDKAKELAKWFASLPKKLVDALGDLGHILYDAGAKILSGLWDGIKSGFGKIKDGFNWLKNKLTDWKGPPEVDRVLLRPAGQLVMGGFTQGIRDAIPDLQSVLGDVTMALPGQMAPTGTNSVAKTTVAPVQLGPIYINFTGPTPTPAQANAIGQSLGAGIADQFAARSAATAVRTM